MKYGFDEITLRRGSNSYKWDAAADDGILPMWVADMDFRTAPAIIAALQKRALHGIFGYAKVPQQYYSAVINWFERRHSFQIQKEWILFTTGVVPAISAVIKALTQAGDHVIIQTPVYNSFFSSIRNNECETVASELIYKDGKYSIDFNDLEVKTAHPKAKLLLLCSPHNPAGRVWSAAELQRTGEICLRNGVTVVSDEIHCDLVYPPHKHIPFATVGNSFPAHSVTLTAPSKTFNLAGIQVANIIAPNEEMRLKIDRALNISEVCEINAFATDALTAAYNEGEEWLEALKEYLYDNYLFLSAFFTENLPHLSVLPLEGTYLVWVDCRALKLSSKEIARRLLEAEKLWINEGTMYGAAGEGFIRINIATQRERLAKGIESIRKQFGTF